MENTNLLPEIMMDSLCQAMGDSALRKRRLIVDYKDSSGQDINQDLTVWHSPQAADKSLVESVRGDLARSGYTLTSLGELLEDGGARVLYLAPGYLDEAIREMGLKVPEDMTSAMRRAGVHPVNWEELVHGR